MKEPYGYTEYDRRDDRHGYGDPPPTFSVLEQTPSGQPAAKEKGHTEDGFQANPFTVSWDESSDAFSRTVLSNVLQRD
jgi:hypothetical protein